MELLKNRGVALLLCALMVVCSCFLGARLSLMSLRGDAERVYQDGDDGSGMGVAYDLGEILTESYNVSVIAGRYLSDSVLLDEMLARRAELAEADGPAAQFEAAQALHISVLSLGELLSAQTLDSQDETLLARCLTNIESHYTVLTRNSYNEAASAFNAELSAFPANLLGGLTGVRRLELFA